MESISTSVIKLVESGLLGTLLVIAGAIIIALYRDNTKQRDARLEDQKKITSLIVEPLESIKKLVTQEGENRTKDKDEIIDAIDNPKLRRR